MDIRDGILSNIVLTYFFLFSILAAYTHGGCRHMAYTCICACGPSSNVLHYGHAGRPNSRLLTTSDIALLDMGAEYNCYA